MASDDVKKKKSKGYEGMKLVTFNNLIPSHSMKFILWHDVDESDEGVQEEDEDQYSDEEDEVEDVVLDQGFEGINQVLQV